MSTEILAPTTGAAQSRKVAIGERRTVTLIMHAAAGLVAGQNADIQISHDDGTTWQDLMKSGSKVSLNDGNNAVTVYGPGVFRVDKEATTNAAGIYASNDVNL